MLKIKQLTSNYQTNPMGIDETMQFGWVLESDKRNVLQTAYHLQLALDSKFTTIVYDSGIVASDNSTQVYVEGFRPESCTRYYVRTKVHDNHGQISSWSGSSFFETAMLTNDRWKAEFITADSDEDAEVSDARLLRSTFNLAKSAVSARVYATSLGLYELHLNGNRVGDLLFTPGWTSYNKRLLYQTYDITDLVKKGKNAIGALVGAGWYKGLMGFLLKRNHYGKKAAILCQIEITYEDGSHEIIGTDRNWKWAKSEVVFSEIYDGEIYDARLEKEGWDTSNFDDLAWESVDVLSVDKSVLKAQDGEPVKKIESLSVKDLITTPAGETVMDFGQNLTGWIKFSVEGKAGDTVELRHAEILDSDGNFYTENLRSAKASVTYILKGNGIETFEPHFTFQGFRYVKIVSYPGTIVPDNFSAEVIHSVMKPSGSFNCSNPLLNQLQHNILWGLKGNFLDVPTDCPQRDERLGWTGDAQIFIGTACFLMNTYPFFRKWLRDLSADQTPEGGVPYVVPNIIREKRWKHDQWIGSFSSSAWGDASTIIPWTLYRVYGDTQILEEQYESMKGWVDYIHTQASDGVMWESGFHFGDWVALDAEEGSYFGATPTELVATAYYAYSTEILSKTAKILGRIEDVQNYSSLLDGIRKAYQHEFLDKDGRLIPRTQTSCIVSLFFNLLPNNSIKSTVKMLLELLDEHDGHLTTGFVGTPYICHVLSQNGYANRAYDLLLKDDYPSWLYQVKQGATTIWEHWDGLKPDGTMWSSDMNSFNHYAYGAVGEWLYRVAAGLDISEEGAGYKNILIKPEIGGDLSYAEAAYDSVYGKVFVRWDRKNNKITLNVQIPHNTTADLVLNNADEISCSQDANFIKGKSAYHTQLGSGKYTIMYTLS